MRYTEVYIHLSPLDPYRDLLVDALGNEGPYDSFAETPDGLKAYVPTDQYDESWLKTQIDNLQKLSPFTYHLSPSELPDKDWNEEWEKQHQPVLVEADNGKRIWVRAPFHEHRAEADYEVEIEPKMSFGTAHHPTTYMMLSYLAELPLERQRVLDMGCGTAILAILASMRGASQVEAIDVDEWAYTNALENVERNHCTNIHCHLGDASLLDSQFSTPDSQFDLIIANINRNILLRDMETYASVLSHRQPGHSTLLLSGFYTADIPVLTRHAATLGLLPHSTKERAGWAAIELRSNFQ